MTYFNNQENIQTSPIQLELLEALLDSEDINYPWNPAEGETEDFFHHVESQFAMRELLDAELPTRSQAFYETLDHLWSSATNTQHYKCNTSINIIASLKESLQAAMTSRVPQNWIEKIAEKAAEIFNPTQSMGEQLVLCAKAVLPNLGADDLLVLARPYSYAMRNGETQSLESALNKVGEHEWNNLSEIEQARVSLAVAYYALRQLNKFQAEATED
ncbi:hypothetical protein [Calothrix sp. UHCC 0171]|uniref:hypothetical protein n=1 Tax=Calothrix sp. UHCC 0171 TaxID=3110245 RepID=UPI002B204CDF|nr:hypothetical protein [Calothrix sp. UHCC 0171]MEA5570582.1 hypothetical protein [Calothrix sp. UHCC 0171]